MLVSVIPIGNSRGVRLPKALLDQLGIQDQVELEVANQSIILKPVKQGARQGWEQAFALMAAQDEDQLLVAESSRDDAFEQEGWEW